MDQNQRSIAATTAASRGYQFQPARAAIIDLFNLYLGVIYFPIRVTFFFFNLIYSCQIQFNCIDLFIYLFFQFFLAEK